MPIIYPASNNASGEVRIGNRKEGNAWEKFTDLEITSDPEGPDYLTISYKINNQIKEYIEKYDVFNQNINNELKNKLKNINKLVNNQSDYIDYIVENIPKMY